MLWIQEINKKLACFFCLQICFIVFIFLTVFSKSYIVICTICKVTSTHTHLKDINPRALPCLEQYCPCCC